MCRGGFASWPNLIALLAATVCGAGAGSATALYWKEEYASVAPPTAPALTSNREPDRHAELNILKSARPGFDF